MSVEIPTVVIETSCSFPRYLQIVHNWHSSFMRRLIFISSPNLLIPTSGCFQAISLVLF